MTDNRTTELLRKLLDERGVKWRESVNVANCVFTIYESPIFGEIAAMDDGEYLYFRELNGISVTPEQAIAATLGNDEYESKMDALLCRLTNGKWSKTRSYDLDFMESCIDEEFEGLYAKELAYATLGNGTLTAEQVRQAIFNSSTYASYDGVMYYANGINMQAIADELNARAERTCRNNKDKWSRLAKYLFVCSECGWNLADVGNDAIDISARLMKRCPMCGAKVVGE